MPKTTIISGYPGIGKTEFVHRVKIHMVKNVSAVLDLDSAQFHYIRSIDGEKHENPTYPENYISAIKRELETGKYDYILVSTHDVVRERLYEEKIPYIAVIPDPEYCEDEYLRRYVRRGDSPEFIFARHYYWRSELEQIIGACERHYMPCIKLGPTWYLSDIFE